MSARKILVVDDEPDVERLIMRRYRSEIRSGRYDFAFASDGKEALETLEAEDDISIMLCDINMPRMDGLTLLDHLPQLERELGVIMVSAYGDLQNIRTAMNRGAFDFVTKLIDFDDLTTTIEKTDHQTRMLVERHEAKTKLAAVDAELAVAHRIQQSILPPPLSTADNFTAYARMVPARAVGGDFYDVFPLSNGEWIFVVGDVEGKGVPAAIFMAVGYTMIRTMVESVGDPGRCLSQINEHICRIEGCTLVSAVLAYFNPASGRLRYSSAGHHSPMIIDPEGNLGELSEGGGLMLGVMPEQSYEVGEYVMTPGETMVLYTDGITEARNAERDQFTGSRLEKVLVADRGQDAQALADSIIDAVQTFAGDEAASDDMTCLVLSC